MRPFPLQPLLLLSLFSTPLLLAACNDAPPDAIVLAPDGGASCRGLKPKSLDEVYAQHLAPNLATGCAVSGCHATGAGGFKFNNAHELWQATVGKPSKIDPGMPRVTPGDPEHSFLYRMLLPTATDRMPQGGPFLSEAALSEVAAWICAGASEPAPPGTDGGTDGGVLGGTGDGGMDGGGSDGGIGPVITSFSPASGVVGTPVTLLGSGFSTQAESNRVSFNGTLATVTAASTTSLTTSVPSGASTGRIAVTVGGLTATSALDFQVILPNPVPLLSSVAPTSVQVGSSEVTLSLTGSGFIATSTAQLDGNALVTTFASGTALSAVISADRRALAANHTVTVVNPGPGGGTSGGLSFVVQNPSPQLSSLNPSSVTVGSGDLLLTLKGSGYVAASQVALNGVALTTTWVSTTQLTVLVPASQLANTGALSFAVTNPAPGGGTSATATLSVDNPVPTLSSISPSSVTAGVGTVTLTVVGAGFVTSSQVQIDGATFPTAFVSTTQLRATVDAAVTSTGGAHTLVVVNPSPGGGTSNEKTFTVNNPLPTVSSISPSNTATDGAPLTLTVTGSGFLQNSVVQLNGVAVSTTYVSDSAIKGQIPTLTVAGNYAITVINPTPGGGTSNSATLTAAPSIIPTLTGLSPNPGVENTPVT